MGAPRSSDAGKKPAGPGGKPAVGKPAAPVAKAAVPPAKPALAAKPATIPVKPAPAGSSRPVPQSVSPAIPVSQPAPAAIPVSQPAPAGVHVPQAPLTPAPKAGRRLGKKPLLLGVGALLLVIGCVCLIVKLSTGGANDKAPVGFKEIQDDKPLAGLSDLQRDWWNSQHLGTEGCQDADAALADLIENEHQWWQREGLVDKKDPNSLKSLSRLEDMQRDWWKGEGLADGKPSKDPEEALARLEKINRSWWQKESLAKVDRPAPANEDAAAADENQVTLADKERTRNFLKAGGTEASERAVELGLKWFVSQQWPEGGWSFHAKPEKDKTLGPKDNTVVATSFALLPFLARGETHKARVDTGATEYTKPVENGLKYLLLQQKPDGDLRGVGNMYTHGLATITLCEALNMTSDPALREPAQKAVDFIVQAQDPRGGGWRYGPRQKGDTSVTSWQIQALKSGQMAGLHVPRETWEKATKYLKSVSHSDGAGYGYTNGGIRGGPKGDAMTACGMLCRQYLHGGENLASPEMSRGAERLLAAPPSKNVRNIYYYYYATQVLFNIGDERWQTWNPQMRDLLIDMQIKNGEPDVVGCWNTMSHQGGYGGRIMASSMCLLTLEVYYRHLPLNRPELGNVAKSLEEKGKTP